MQEKDINNNLLNLIKKIFNDKSSINNILSNQMNYSDKNVFNNIQVQFEKILDEKN